MVSKNKVITSTVEMGRATIVVEASQIDAKYARTDFLQALIKKVSKRRSMPIGENVRDAINSIKGKQEPTP